MTLLYRMLLLGTTLCALLFPTAPALRAAPLNATDAPPRVHLSTNLGDIVVELDPVKAPETVKNFLGYVGDGAYDGTVFHRVIPGFMVQAGGYTRDYTLVATRKPIRNEAANGLHNVSGTVAMARTDQPHSATAQFFINVADNGFLDHRDETVRGWGYAVFGKVVEGMDVVRKIEQSPTTQRDLSPAPGIRPLPASDVPRNAIVIEKAVLEPSAPAASRRK